MRLPSLFLSFKDLELEIEFKRSYDYETRVFNRIGIWLSFLSWIVIIIFSYVYFPENFIHLAVVIATPLFPLFTIILLILSYTSYVKYFQRLTAVANGLAGLVFIYVGHFVLDNNIFTISGLIAVIFFAFLILRLRFKIALYTTLFYVVVFEVILLIPSDHKTGDIALLSAIVWLIEIICIVGGNILERTSRQIYCQNKVIESKDGMKQRFDEILEAINSRGSLLEDFDEEIFNALVGSQES